MSWIWIPTSFLLVILIAYGFCDRIIFRPPTEFGSRLPNEITLKNEAGEDVSVRYTPAPNGGVTILHSHGNAETLNRIAMRHDRFVERGYGFLSYDYEGYGRSSGKPSEAGAYRCIERVWKYLTEERGVEPHHIILFGFSVGTGPSTYLAAKVPARGLVLQAPFTSTFAVAGLGWLPGNRFPSIDRIDRINMPLWILHGDRDSTVPQFLGKRLFKAAKEPKCFWDIKGAGHNDIRMVTGEEYWHRWELFARGE